MKVARRDPPTAHRTRLSRGSVGSRRGGVLRARGPRWSASPFIRRMRSGPLGQDALIASLLTTASLFGLFVHLHVDLPEGAADPVNRRSSPFRQRSRGDMVRS